MRLVFVSSTFKDMQFERDELKNRVTPRIDAFLSSYGENVYFGDLRWGVNTSELDSEESSKKVLKICLDEIDNCRPYMIVFIGERYGWIPTKELIKEAKGIKGFDNGDDDISVTNLEIEYGAFLSPSYEGHILFYFRNLDTSEMDPETKKIYEAEDAYHKDKLENLKRRIIDKYPSYVREYNAKYDKKTNSIVNLSPVMDMVYNDLCHIFKIDLEAFRGLPIHKRAIVNSHTRFEKYYTNAYLRTDLDYSLGERKDYRGYYTARYDEVPMMRCVFGDVGSGRKTYLATLYKKALENKDYVTIPYVNGMDEFTSGKETFLATLTGSVEEALGKNHKENPNAEYLSHLLKELKKKKKYVQVFVMNITEELYTVIRGLEASANGVLSQIDNIFFYVQDEESEPNKSSALPFALKSKATYVSALDDDENKLGIINAILKNQHKELPTKIIKKILKKEGSINPLYLSLIIERLLMLDHQDFEAIRGLGDDMKAIEKYMSSIVDKSGNDIKEISKELLKELAERINPHMIPTLIDLFTRGYRLNHDDTKRFFDYIKVPFNDIDYALFLHSIPSLFLDSSLTDEFVEFKCDDIKNAAKELVKSLKVKDHSKDLIKFVEEYDFGSDVSRDSHLFALYYEFKDVKKCANLFLRVIDKFSLEYETDYEEEMLSNIVSMNQILYRDEDPFFIDVLKEVGEQLSKGTYKDFGKLATYFYIPFSFYFVNKKEFLLMGEWAIELLYHLSTLNEGGEGINFLFLAGITTILQYINEAGVTKDIKDEIEIGEREDDGLLDKFHTLEKYLDDKYISEYHIQYNALYSAGKLDYRFLQDNESKSFFTIFSNALDTDEETTKFLEDYYDLIEGQYSKFVLNREVIRNVIEEKTHLTKEDIEVDRGLSLISTFMYFLKQYYVDEVDEATFRVTYHQFSRLLSDYLANDFFFIKDKYATNYGTFIFTIITRLVSQYVHLPMMLQVDYVINRSLLFDALKKYLAINPGNTNLLIEMMSILVGSIEIDGKAEPSDFTFIYPLANKALYVDYDETLLRYLLFLMAHFQYQVFNGQKEIDEKMVTLLINFYLYYASNTENAYYRLHLVIYKYLKAFDRLNKNDIFLEKVYSDLISLLFEIEKEEFINDFFELVSVWEEEE